MLTFSTEMRNAIEAHAVETYPLECCGVIVGRVSDGLREGIEIFRARNLNDERAHDRYDLDPRDFVRIDREARERGLDVIGIYHSHPDHPAQPSETDLAGAWSGYSYVIVVVNDGEPGDLCSFELTADGFEQEEVRVA